MCSKNPFLYKVQKGTSSIETEIVRAARGYERWRYLLMSSF
jgi:hypothetical protein